jgi:serine/threonine-protein kinase
MNSFRKSTAKPLRVGTKLGKYRIERRLADGPFADVFRAYDTIEGIRVALKIPHAHLMDAQFLEEFRKEVRLLVKLDHGNILPVKNAAFLDGHFVIAFPLGERTLAERLQSRMSLRTALDLAEQALDAVAHAHSRRIIHCDIKPENFLIFPGGRLRLADFGIAKVALRTMDASGSGTIGYVAPEQAMGRPSFKSDVFSLGLVFYRMLAGRLPQWPFEWPPPGFARLRSKAHSDLIKLIRRSIEVNPDKRFRDAGLMLAEFRKVKPRSLAFTTVRRRKSRKKNSRAARDWKDVQRRQFQRAHGRALETRHTCLRCKGPVSEAMRHCPWCGVARKTIRDDTRFPARCPRCGRGVKADWKFCAWCYGRGFDEVTERTYADKRYEARCSNPGCTRKVLMPFMRYCPWCRRAVQKKWKIEGSRHKCPSCGWGVLPAYWSHCPWCGRSLAKR